MSHRPSKLPPFDLTIENYTLRDVERFFNLKSNQQYQRKDIEEKEYRIREQLLKSGHVDKRLKGELIEFLEKAKKWLIEERTIVEPPGTVIPKSHQWDSLDYPKLAPVVARQEEINVRQETKFIYTQPSTHFSGIINPLDKRVITKCLAIDTKFRNNYANSISTDFNLQLPDRFTKVVSMQLTAIEIPRSYYNIASVYGNNYFFMAVGTEIDPDFTETNIFVIPDGYYTSQALVDMINLLLTQKGGLFLNVKFSLDVFSDGSGTNKVSIDTDFISRPILFVDFDFSKDINGNADSTPLFQKLGWMLGFLQPSYSSCIIYTAESTILTETLSYIYLAIDDYNNNVNNGFVSAFTDSIMNKNILARISVNSCGKMGETIIKEDSNIITQPREYFGPVDIQKMQIRLYDGFGRILYLNGRDFSFCLILKILYDL
jgi:hypothetical protein